MKACVLAVFDVDSAPLKLKIGTTVQCTTYKLWYVATDLSTIVLSWLDL